MSDPDVDRLARQITRVLRVGVGISAIALGLGLLAGFSGAPIAITLFVVGLVTLMALPVVRTVASLVDAIRRRDALLMWSAVFVLAVMAITLMHALGAE